MTVVNNWVKERHPIVYPLVADGRRFQLKLASKYDITKVTHDVFNMHCLL